MIKKNVCIKLKQILVGLLLFVLPVSINAQNKKLSKKQFLIDSLKIIKPRMVRPQFKIDNRLVFFDWQLINIKGLDVGVVLKNKLRITAGYYSLLNKNLTSLNKLVDLVPYDSDYSLRYGSINLEALYKNSRFFSLGMPVEFGIGSNTLNYISTVDATEIDSKTGKILLTYFGLSGTFKPIRWLGLKTSVGYRKTLFNQLKDMNFDGFYASVGLIIDFAEVTRDVKMYSLKRKYRKNFNPVGTAVDLITD